MESTILATIITAASGTVWAYTAPDSLAAQELKAGTFCPELSHELSVGPDDCEADGARGVGGGV